MSGPAIGAHLPVRASAYVRNYAGLATVNPDIDIQTVGAPVQQRARRRLPVRQQRPRRSDGHRRRRAATFELFGVGTISACRDPDAAGPMTSVRHDHNGDGTFQHCHVSGYQSTGTGAKEYHARVNNTSAAGQFRVLFCYDTDRDGCLDESVRSQVAIGWTPRRG